MPSQHSSDATQQDARALAAALGCDLRELPIAAVYGAFERALQREFAGCQRDATEESLQARIRATMLMALANKFGWLLLATGNKSEAAVGYFTLYGDGAGGLGVLQDVTKTMVYRLARWRNQRDGDHPVPDGILTRAPSAELSPGQRDSDTLPTYDQLDDIIARHVEDGHSAQQLAAAGHDPATVTRVLGMMRAAEHKRHQAPPGIIVSAGALGERRMPLTSRFGP